jgi:hypothetical protein
VDSPMRTRGAGPSTPSFPAGVGAGHDGPCPGLEPPTPTFVEGGAGSRGGVANRLAGPAQTTVDVAGAPSTTRVEAGDLPKREEPAPASTPSLEDYRGLVLAGARLFDPQHQWIYPSWLVAVCCASCGTRWLGMKRHQPCKNGGKS